MKIGPFPAKFNLSTLDGTNGFSITGQDDADDLGHSVSGVGDVNGDGIDDFIVGAPGASSVNVWAGISYIILGNKGAFPSNLEVSSIKNTIGFAITGQNSGDKLGYSVSGAGDFNGDGLDDIIIGAYGYPNRGYQGRSYVVFGRRGVLLDSINVSDLNGTNGFSITGQNNSNNLGYSVKSAGDVNGDGYVDLIIGASAFNNFQGRSYILFGHKGSFPANINIQELNGINGFSITGQYPSDQLGYSVSGAGDLNGDGFNDVIVGAYGYPRFQREGRSYVVFGHSGPFPTNIDVTDLNGNNGFSIAGQNRGDAFGYCVSEAGDINGDGYADVIVGAMGYPNDKYQGRSYIIFGNKGNFPANMDVTNLDGTNGFSIVGQSSFNALGTFVNRAGDINGDGYDDVIIGANGYPDNDEQERSYVLFGRKEGFSTDINITTLNGVNGFSIIGQNPGDIVGCSGSGAGDINGDNCDDLLVGALGYPARKSHGRSYVVFGRCPNDLSNSTLILTLGGIVVGIIIIGVGIYLAKKLYERIQNRNKLEDDGSALELKNLLLASSIEEELKNYTESLHQIEAIAHRLEYFSENKNLNKWVLEAISEHKAQVDEFSGKTQINQKQLKELIENTRVLARDLKLLLEETISKLGSTEGLELKAQLEGIEARLETLLKTSPLSEEQAEFLQENANIKAEEISESAPLMALKSISSENSQNNFGFRTPSESVIYI